MRREKLKVVPRRSHLEQSRHTPRIAPGCQESHYVLDDQVGFLLRVAMQRHTSIFTTRMIEGLTQTQFAALAKLTRSAPARRTISAG